MSVLQPHVLVKIIGLCVIVALIGAACLPAAPPPSPEGVIMPKQLATVVISPTAVFTLVVPPTSTRMPSPTPTRVPPTATPSPTPYVGVFMGNGSAPLVLPTASVIPLVDVTLIPPTPLGGVSEPVFPTATPAVSVPGAVAPIASGSCSFEPDAIFLNAYYNNANASGMVGCPVGPAETMFMAQQTFEHGTMIWLSTGEIIALASNLDAGMTNVYWQVQDQWQEGMPQDDPSMTVPPGLLQPIRGFGMAWRLHPQIRSTLGWAINNEDGYSGTFQRFERGMLLTAQDGSVYALVPSDSPPTQGQYLGPLF